jgi:hypothetical protein
MDLLYNISVCGFLKKKFILIFDVLTPLSTIFHANFDINLLSISMELLLS